MMINATDEFAPANGDDSYGFGWVVYDDPKHGKQLNTVVISLEVVFFHLFRP